LAPENTLAAFQLAVNRYRTDVLEIDIQQTLDGVWVISHDDTLERCTNGEGPIANHNLSQIQRLDAGYWFSPEAGKSFPYRGQGVRIPTLAEALCALPTLRFNIDLKTANADQVSAFSRLMREQGATDRICCGTESDELAAVLFEALPEACHFYPRQALTHFVLAVRAGEPPALDPRFAVLDMPFAYQGIPLIDAQLLEAAKRSGRWVNVWTVDEPGQMRELIGLGVGGIMTDRPDLLRQALDERRASSNA
jgi:glycerophosphoryl diester phosphodiesterase